MLQQIAEPGPVARAELAKRDRSMQILEYLVASVAVVAALILAFVR